MFIRDAKLGDGWVICGQHCPLVIDCGALYYTTLDRIILLLLLHRVIEPAVNKTK